MAINICTLKEWRVMMETWLSFVAEVGFPVVITFYLLHRIEEKLDVLNESIRVLPHKIRENDA